MIRKLIEGRLRAAERDLGVSLEYARAILRASLPAFLKFTRVLSLAEHRRRASADAFHVAKLVAAKSEDCGSCVQVAVHLARKDEVAPERIEAVLDARVAELSPELREVYHFAVAVADASGRSGDAEPWRERIRERWGDEVLVELALAIASGRFFPVLKRGLGYAKRCEEVELST